VVGLPSTVAPPPAASSPYSQIDVRNVYFQFGNNDWGTLKFGRDIGLFGQNIILSDMTLLGVGGTSNAGIPFNTTFGMIGHGYMYTGFQAQITYTTPNFNGLQASAGIFQPSPSPATRPRPRASRPRWITTGRAHARQGLGRPGEPEHQLLQGLHLQRRGHQPGQDLHRQRLRNRRQGRWRLRRCAYAFTGKGLGLSTVGAQFFGGSDGLGNKTDSKGYFLQGTYQLNKTKFGINFGQNKDNDGLLGAGNERKNKAYTLGVYHSLNKFVTLVGELNQEKITAPCPISETRTAPCRAARSCSSAPPAAGPDRSRQPFHCVSPSFRRLVFGRRFFVHRIPAAVRCYRPHL
jgi:predicted porin